MPQLSDYQLKALRALQKLVESDGHIKTSDFTAASGISRQPLVWLEKKGFVKSEMRPRADGREKMHWIITPEGTSYIKTILGTPAQDDSTEDPAPPQKPADPPVCMVAGKRIVRVLRTPSYVPQPWVLPRADAQDFLQHQRNPYAR